MERKKKVLLLSTHDSHLPGHAWSCMRQYDKSKYEVGLVSLYSLYADKSCAIVSFRWLYLVIAKLLRLVDNKFLIKKNTKYCYFNTISFPISVNQILKKYPLGKPDIIVLHWYDGFITSKIIKQLYNIII